MIPFERVPLLEQSGARWEVYGHWTNDEAQVRTDVFYLLDASNEQ
jgi:hypothetical protein